MARPKRKSDEIYNERRRLKRLKASLEKNKSRAFSSAIARLGSLIESSYYNRKTRQYINQNFKKEAAKIKKGVKAQPRRNAIFQEQINLAGGGNFSLIAKDENIAQGLVKIFYQSTRRFYEGKDLEKRNEYILQALGMTDLKTAFNYVLKKNKDAVQQLYNSLKTVDATDEEAFIESEQVIPVYENTYLLYTTDLARL